MPNPIQTDDDAKFGTWAMVELFGHTRLAGYVSEFSIGSASYIRVDVPKVGSTVPEPFTKIYGPAAIYCITPCSEEAVKVALLEIKPRPLSIPNRYDY